MWADFLLKSIILTALGCEKWTEGRQGAWCCSLDLDWSRWTGENGFPTDFYEQNVKGQFFSPTFSRFFLILYCKHMQYSFLFKLRLHQAMELYKKKGFNQTHRVQEISMMFIFKTWIMRELCNHKLFENTNERATTMIPLFIKLLICVHILFLCKC